MIQPVGSRLLIAAEALETKTGAGILLPGNSSKIKNVGTVRAVGTGRILENGEHLKPEVNIGDKVIFAQYAGTHIAYNDEDIFLVDERDILAVIRE